LGHKVHPTGFRLGIIRDWQAKWYADRHYAEFLQEDVKLREAIRAKYREAAISLVEIDRQAKDVMLTLHTARPGIVIGRGGQRVDEIRIYLENLIGKKTRLNIQEIRQPELDAYLVARNIADQIEHRVAYRRAMRQATFRTMQAGAKGIKVSCAGRLGNAEIARRQTMLQGQVPLHTLRADIDYAFTEAHTTLGRIGVKVWIYKGLILPEPKVTEAAETAEMPAAPPVPQAEITPAKIPEEKPAEPVAGEVTVAAAEETETVPADLEAEATAGAAAEEVTEIAAEKPEEPATEAVEKPKRKTARTAAKKTETETAEPVTEAIAEKPEEPATEAVEKPKRKTARTAAKKTETEAATLKEEEKDDTT